MMNKARAQCLIVREDKILLVKHCQHGVEYFCAPGGGVEDGETPKQAAKRELSEECNVTGTRLKLISKTIHDNHYIYTFYADIGKQEPTLGCDPECSDNPILVGCEWKKIDELCERERAWMWAAGLAYYKVFAAELDSWGDEISYPAKR